jgi:hypothetical protein
MSKRTASPAEGGQLRTLAVGATTATVPDE